MCMVVKGMPLSPPRKAIIHRSFDQAGADCLSHHPGEGSASSEAGADSLPEWWGAFPRRLCVTRLQSPIFRYRTQKVWFESSGDGLRFSCRRSKLLDRRQYLTVCLLTGS